MTTTTLELPDAEVGVAAKPQTSPRLLWIDLIKATSVLLVVQMHFVLMLLDTTQSDVTGFWYRFVIVLEPLRMPIFFMVSGMMASEAVRRGWRSNRRRTFGTTYLYVIWSVVMAATAVAITPFTSIGAIVSKTAANLAIPTDGYWYLYALVLYFIVAKLALRWPAWIVVGLAAIPALMRPQTVDIMEGAIEPFLNPGMLSAVVLNLVFFLVGAYFKDLIVEVADAARWGFVVLIGVGALMLSMARWGDGEHWGDSILLLSALWIVTGIMLAQLLVRWRAPRRFAASIGTRTLPIFVMQFPLMQMAVLLLGDTTPAILLTSTGQILFPLVATALVTSIALGLHRLVQTTPFRYLFHAPRWAVHPGFSGKRLLPEISLPAGRTATVAATRPCPSGPRD